MAKQNSKLPAAVRKQFADWGRKGGLSGSVEDKKRAGKLSGIARKAKTAESENHESQS